MKLAKIFMTTTAILFVTVVALVFYIIYTRAPEPIPLTDLDIRNITYDFMYEQFDESQLEKLSPTVVDMFTAKNTDANIINVFTINPEKERFTLEEKIPNKKHRNEAILAGFQPYENYMVVIDVYTGKAVGFAGGIE